jgi:hypothetical protein
VPECPYYEPTGRIEDDVIIAEFEERRKRRDEKTRLLKRKWEEHYRTGRTWISEGVDATFRDI